MEIFWVAKRWTKKSSHSKWDFSNLWMQYVIYIFSFELCINVMKKFVVLHFHYHFLLYRYRNNVNWVCCSWIHAKYYIVIFNISYNLLNISLSLSLVALFIPIQFWYWVLSYLSSSTFIRLYVRTLHCCHKGILSSRIRSSVRANVAWPSTTPSR